jgi:hypothetical protein
MKLGPGEYVADPTEDTAAILSATLARSAAAARGANGS